MKIIIIFLLALCPSVYLMAQITFLGSVRDIEKSVLPYVNILSFSTPDTLFIAGTITDETGKYEIHLNDSFTGYLEFRSTGFESKIVPIVE